MGENRLKKFLFPTQDKETNEINFRNSFASNAPSGGMEVKDIDNDLKSFETPSESKRKFRTAGGDINGSNIHTPNCYGDAEKIAMELINRNPIIVNLESVLNNQDTCKDAQRIIDFLCGVALALDIEVKSINTTAFFFSPKPKQHNY